MTFLFSLGLSISFKEEMGLDPFFFIFLLFRKIATILEIK